jgi:hypothetical protein
VFTQLAPNVAEDTHLLEVDRPYRLGGYLTANSTAGVRCDFAVGALAVTVIGPV